MCVLPVLFNKFPNNKVIIVCVNPNYYVSLFFLESSWGKAVYFYAYRNREFSTDADYSAQQYILGRPKLFGISLPNFFVYSFIIHKKPLTASPVPVNRKLVSSHTDVKATKIAQGQFWTVFIYQLRLLAVNEAYPIEFVAKFWINAAKISLLGPSFLRVLKQNLTHATIQNKRFTSRCFVWSWKSLPCTLACSRIIQIWYGIDRSIGENNKACSVRMQFRRSGGSLYISQLYFQMA